MIREIKGGEGTDAKKIFWIDVQQPTPGELDQLAAAHGIPETLIKDCLDPSHLPKYEVYDQIRFFIFRFSDEAAAERSSSDTVRELTRKAAIFLVPGGIITVHRCSHDFLDIAWEVWSKKFKEKNQQLSHLFNFLVRELVRTYERSLVKMEDTFERYETSMLEPVHEERLEHIYFLKRKATVYKKMLWALKDTLRKAEDLPFRNTTHFKNLVEEADKQFFHAEELTEDVNHLMSTQLSIASHRTNEVLRILTLFSVFFMPLTFVVGIYGMNFQHMPELRWEYGYPAVLGGMVLLALVIAYWFKRKRWI